MKQAWQRPTKDWRNRKIHSLLSLRDSYRHDIPLNLHNIDEAFDSTAWIYLLVHFPSGRCYTGHTSRRIRDRTKEHWHDRSRKQQDRLHNAMLRDKDPYTFIMLPIERLPPAGQHDDPEQQRKEDILFRRIAHSRERYWTAKFDTMWPRGYNAAWPGKPVGRSNRTNLSHQPSAPTAHAASQRAERWDNWLSTCRSDSSFVEAEMHNIVHWPKDDLRSLLDHLQEAITDHAGRLGVFHLESKLIAELRRRRQEAPPRQFLRFTYSNRAADLMCLPEVL